MGEILSMMNCKPCDSCIKYVLNDIHCHSNCSDCCEIDIDTNPIEIQSEAPDEIEIGIYNSEDNENSALPKFHHHSRT